MSTPVIRLADLVETLARHEVEFILVGGAAAVLHGAPVVTYDVDIVHRRTRPNIERLLTALSDLGATYRHDARGLSPQVSHLESSGHQLLMTHLGPLDVLGSIEDGTTYDDLLPATVEVEVRGRRIRAISLARLVESKERVGRPKDLAVLDLLRAVLVERRRQEAGD